MAVDSGRRVEVDFSPAYSGQAGLAVVHGVTTVAFVADARRLFGVRSGTVDGLPVTITAVERSAFVPKMVVLTAAGI